MQKVLLFLCLAFTCISSTTKIRMKLWWGPFLWVFLLAQTSDFFSKYVIRWELPLTFQINRHAKQNRSLGCFTDHPNPWSFSATYSGSFYPFPHMSHFLPRAFIVCNLSQKQVSMTGLMDIFLRSKEGKKEYFPKEKRRHLRGKRNSLKDIPTTSSSTFSYSFSSMCRLLGHIKRWRETWGEGKEQRRMILKWRRKRKKLHERSMTSLLSIKKVPNPADIIQVLTVGSLGGSASGTKPSSRKTTQRKGNSSFWGKRSS